MNYLQRFWKGATHFFEYGDLTPLAVIISIAHYGPVLAERGESMAVAWIVGALVDLLHFRSVRRAAVRLSMLNGVIALATTAMAVGYHLRFYDNDWLLALPIPAGIAILAQHAATSGKHDNRKLWHGRIKRVIKIARKLQASADQAQASAEQAQTAADEAQATIKRLQVRTERQQAEIERQQAIIEAWQHLNEEAQTLARFNAGQIEAEQAASIIGVKDIRTVQSRAAKLNGIAKATS